MINIAQQAYVIRQAGAGAETPYLLTVKYFGFSCSVVRSVLTAVSKDPNSFIVRATHSEQSGNVRS